MPEGNKGNQWDLARRIGTIYSAAHPKLGEKGGGRLGRGGRLESEAL